MSSSKDRLTVGQQNSLRFRSNKEEFIRKAVNIHGEKYNYVNVVYVNAHTKVAISCPQHGEFYQKPNNHLSGKGCEPCAFEYRARTKSDRVSSVEFLRRAMEVHGEKFQYNLEEYLRYDFKITMICPKQHEFKQSPEAHVRLKQGCPFCKESKGESLIQELLRKHNIDFVREYILPETKYTFRYDFFLPTCNLLIEFHGGQHYQAVDFFGGEEAFQATRRRDLLKKVLAKETGRKIVYFNYKHLRMQKERFEKILIAYISRVTVNS